MPINIALDRSVDTLDRKKTILAERHESRNILISDAAIDTTLMAIRSSNHCNRSPPIEKMKVSLADTFSRIISCIVWHVGFVYFDALVASAVLE